MVYGIARYFVLILSFTSFVSGFEAGGQIVSAEGRPASLTRPQLNVKQYTMLQTLQQVITVFSQAYAPIEWKISSEKLDLRAEVARARQKIESSPDITTTEFQDLLVDLIQATRDFHVGITFYSTEEATLPFRVRSAEGRYFVSVIDRTKLSLTAMPDFVIGTEIIEFGGKPIREVVRGLIPERYKEPSASEWRSAELSLTKRSRRLGEHVPLGEIAVKYQAVGAASAKEVPFYWDYTPEFVPVDKAFYNLEFEGRPALEPGLPKQDKGPAKLKVQLKESSIDGTQTAKAGDALVDQTDSVVPPLGFIFASGTSDNFKNYLFKSPSGHLVGYVRIPTFLPTKLAEAAEEFGRLMTSFDERTDALVIDLTYNGGGSISYMYGLLSRLTDRPLQTLKHRIMISSQLTFESAKRLANESTVKNEEDASHILKDLMPGLMPSYQLFQGLIQYDKFLLAELIEGRRLSRPTYFWGVGKILPHPSQRYTKPIVVIVDELDFSAADFFPATLQDNKRAVIFGAKTAGAGGAVQQTSFPNQFNIESLSYTWTIAERVDGRPLENLGVTPDVPYEITIDDLRGQFKGYRDAILKTVESVLK